MLSSSTIARNSKANAENVQVQIAKREILMLTLRHSKHLFQRVMARLRLTGISYRRFLMTHHHTRGHSEFVS
jgi:hypothetical protein